MFDRLTIDTGGGGWPCYILCSLNVTCHRLGGRSALIGVPRFGLFFILNKGLREAYLLKNKYENTSKLSNVSLQT